MKNQILKKDSKQSFSYLAGIKLFSDGAKKFLNVKILVA